VIRVVAAVALRRGRVLVCQRAAAKRHPGKWEFPGGKVERGETLARALRRELREELRVDTVLGREVWRTQHRYPGGHAVELRFFSVRSLTGRLRRGAELAAVRWQPASQLAALDFLDADRDLVAEIASGRLKGLCETTRATRREGTGLAARASTSARSRGARRGR
jgi:8-oxo-dGTP diphosphatase